MRISLVDSRLDFEKIRRTSSNFLARSSSVFFSSSLLFADHITERGHNMTPSTHNLRRLLEYQHKNPRLEKFEGQGRLILMAVDFIIKLCSLDDKVIASLQQLDDSARDSWGYNRHTKQYGHFVSLFRSFLAELGVFLAVPKSKGTLNLNELVAVFIDLLIEILQEILRLQPYFILPTKESIEALKMELKFLITFLGDTPILQHIETEATKHLLTDIETVANGAGTFLYSSFFTADRVSMTKMHQSLSEFLGEVENTKEKIKEHCMRVSKMPDDTAQKTGGVYSLSIVHSLLDRLKDLINQKDDRISAVKDQIKTIHDNLMSLLSFLGDGEMQRHRNLDEFFIRIGDIAYEVEYIISSFAPVWYLTLRLCQIMNKIELIRIPLLELIKDYATRLVEMSKDAEYPSQPAPKSHIEEEIVVGLDSGAREIINLLIGGAIRLQIISICGMGGLGKTTLVKKLYNDLLIVNHFNHRAWFMFSQTCDIREILIDVLSTIKVLDRHKILNMAVADMKYEVYKCLKGSRYLIVIDDVWDRNAWEELEGYFPDDRNGSRILITTRSVDVGLQVSSNSDVYEFPFLSDEECWNLLQRKVFHEKPCPPELVDIGKIIARKCGGLPLAVVVAAGILANLERKKCIWEEVAQRLTSYLCTDQNKYMNALKLSYNNLPMHLKPCFLYFGVFKEDKEIPVRKLISLWVAEGFIEKIKNKSSEDAAEEYLTNLIDRSLVLVAKRRSDGGVKTCKVHVLLHVMCLRIAEAHNFLKVVTDNYGARSSLSTLSIYDQHHRLSIQSRSIPSYSGPFGLHLRSLLGHLHDPSTYMFCNLKLLRVLDLPTIDLRQYSPTSMEVLVLLRFLAVSSIPSSMELFSNLEFLFVNNKDLVQVPETLFNMVKLRHLNFSGGAQFSESWFKDHNFQTNHLENVSFLYIRNENDEKILTSSPFLRRLKCRIRVIWDSTRKLYRYPHLHLFNHLNSLTVSICPCVSNDVGPIVIAFPVNLEKLTVRNFDVSGAQMSIIGSLPGLKVLKLQHGSIEDKKWVTREGEFPQLIFLELNGLQIKQWEVSSDHFPRLEQLVLQNCHHLECIPSSLGDVILLRMIVVHNCVTSVEASARQIQEEQENMGNDELRVIIGRSTTRLEQDKIESQ